MLQEVAVFDGVGEADLPKVASIVLQQFQANKVWLLKGDLGAGKTTFVKCLCVQLGAKGEFASPTYSIVNEYVSKEGKPIYHIDLYRLEGEAEAVAAGVEEYLYSDNYCFIEWYERAAGLLPEKYLLVHIEGSGESRKISIFGLS